MRCIVTCLPGQGHPGALPVAEAGRYDPAIGPVQGTKIVITGPTNVSCTELAHRLADAGMDVMSGISRKTGLLVVNAGAPHSRKLERAGEFGTPIVDEATVLRLAADPVAGVPKSAPAEIEVIDVISTPARPRNRPGRGPAADLVLGGSHLEATVMRSRIVHWAAFRPSTSPHGSPRCWCCPAARATRG